MASAVHVAVNVADKIEAKRLVPSDRSWRLKNYYMLVEKQRHLASLEVVAATDAREDDACCWPGGSSEWGEVQEEEEFTPTPASSTPEIIPQPGLCLRPDSGRDQVQERIIILGTLVKAGCLLASQPINVLFQHEEEQRLVYALAYDAYRYRSVFNQALQDTNFFTTFPQLHEETMLVHLLLCQMYRRRFSSREPPWPSEAASLQALWHATGMSRVEDALWEVRVRLAAALARLRIKSNALRLEQLLPASLRSKAREGIIGEEQDGEHHASSAAWVNTFKIRVSEVTSLLEDSGLALQTAAEAREGTGGVRNFHLDARCPGLLRHHPALRADLAQSQLVRDGFVVLQGRAFCLGPGVFCRVLEDIMLTGSVVQSHASSPRTTAYLACLLAACSEPHALITFGAGTRKAEFEAYLSRLGAVNVTVRAERFSELTPDSSLLDGVVAVLALPPNSHSAVHDPVELACSSGGDLRVLEELALAAEGGCDAALRRQEALQQEQRNTLRLALAAPQIQFVLFESHSNSPAETRDLLLHEVTGANDAARERQNALSAASHARAVNTLMEEGPPTDRESTADSASVSATHEQHNARVSSAVTEHHVTVTVPPTDLFELSPLQAPSENEEFEENPCPALEEDGCFLALLKRQEITRLDAQYMIQIAESRGLFGASAKKNSPSASSRRTPRKKPPDLKQLLNQGKQKMKDRRNEDRGPGSERISAPTVASLLRQSVPSSGSSGSSPVNCLDCHRLKRAVEPPPDLCTRYHFARRQDARRWWSEAAQRVLALARMPNPSLLPRFRLVRTPLPAVGASTREPYPLSVRQLELSEHSDTENDDESVKTL